MSVVARLLPPRRVGDHVAILPQQGLDDLEYPGISDGSLDEAASIQHLVSKWDGLFRRVSALVWWKLLEHSFDIGAQCREILSYEDAIENDVAI